MVHIGTPEQYFGDEEPYSVQVRAIHPAAVKAITGRIVEPPYAPPQDNTPLILGILGIVAVVGIVGIVGLIVLTWKS